MEAFYYDKLLVTYLTRCIAKYLLLLAYIRAHNPKVGGSNPSPATKKRTLSYRRDTWGFSLFWSLICAVSNNALIYAKRALYGHYNHNLIINYVANRPNTHGP